MLNKQEVAAVVASASPRLGFSRLSTEARARGLKPVMLGILACAAGRPGISPGQIATRLRVSVGTVSYAVDALEREGLARRQSNPRDRRRLCIYATESGLAVLEAIVAATRVSAGEQAPQTARHAQDTA
jgi:DNA-binding MarR family transcriptional regulator